MVKDITVVDTNYNEYALVLKHKVFHREYTQVALYGETGARARLPRTCTPAIPSTSEPSQHVSPVCASRTRSDPQK